MAASKSRPPEMPIELPQMPAPLASRPAKLGAPPEKPAAPSPSPSAGPSKVRAGMGDVEAEVVEIWSDEDHRRATGLARVLDEEGRADPAAVPAVEPERLRAIYRAMVRIRTFD